MYHNRRNRLRSKHIRRMVRGQTIGLLPVLLLVFLVEWTDVLTLTYHRTERYQKIRFHEICEELTPQLESYYLDHGKMPETLDGFGYQFHPFFPFVHFDTKKDILMEGFTYHAHDGCFEMGMNYGNLKYYYQYADTAYYIDFDTVHYEDQELE